MATSGTQAAGYAAQIVANRRWNFCVNVADLTFYNLALSFIYSTTILPVYVSYLTTSAVLIGLVPALQEVASYLPQIVLARRTEGLERKKPFVVRLSVLERLPYLFIAVSIFIWPRAPAWFAYAFLVFGLTTARGSGGLAGPAWVAMVGKIIHPDRKGLMFGLGLALGGVLGIGGAWLVGRVLSTHAYPFSFGLCFLLSFAAQAVSWGFLALNREPPQASAPSALTPRDYFRQVPGILRRNPDFSRFLLSQTLIIFGGLGMGFYIIYARRTFQISDAFLAAVTIAAMASQSLGTPLVGWLSDRLGHKWINGLSALLGAGAALMMLLLPGPLWLYLVFILMNLSIAGLSISRMSLIMEFGGAERLPTFVALANTLLALPILLAPVMGGWVIEGLGYRWLFLLAVALAGSGWLLLMRGVRDPRVRR
jgi:MFS family permease